MSTQRFPLPDVGEGLTEAEIVEWRVAVGDTVTVNQVVVEIETAKSLVELPSPWEGRVSALLVEPGTMVDVGTPIIEISTGAEELSEPAPNMNGSGSDTSSAEAADARSAADAGSGSVLVGYGTAAETAGSGRRRRRAAPPPAPVSEAQRAIAAHHGSDTAGAGADVSEAQRAIAHHGSDTAGAGADVSEAQRGIAHYGSDNGETPAEPPERAGVQRALASVPVPASGTTTDGGAATSTRARVLAKPPVRKLAKDLGVDLTTVVPTGPGGIVTREDVVARAEAATPHQLADRPGDEPWTTSGTVSPDGRQTRVPVKSVRKRTAEAMVASAFTAPHVTVFHTVDVTKTMRLVAALKEDRDFSDVRVTPLLIAAKAVLLAVRRHPQINASWDDAAQEIVYKHYVNLGIAAATPRGLVVPNVKDAHALDLHGLAVAIGELTSTARAGRTSPADMADGTFTITNVGVFGIDSGTPILNPGEAGILAFGAIRQHPWVHKGKIKPRWVTQLALSFDHRLVDGELGARFLSDVAKVLEDPARGLVWG